MPSSKGSSEISAFANIGLWFCVLFHIINPWSLWRHTSIQLLSCTFAFSIIQIPPFRYYFQKKLGYWPVKIRSFMPANKIDSSLRQSFGPPFVLYTLSTSIHYFHLNSKHKNINEKTSGDQLYFLLLLSVVSATMATFAGVFCRPDNDWANTSWIVGRINSKARKRTHGLLMIFSTMINVIMLYYEVKQGSTHAKSFDDDLQ